MSVIIRGCYIGECQSKVIISIVETSESKL